MEKRVFVDEERIYKTFKMFDIHNKNKISNGDLWEILHKLENYKNITKEYCSLLISEVDRDNDGEVEYLEFIDMFFKRAWLAISILYLSDIIKLKWNFPIATKFLWNKSLLIKATIMSSK